VKNESCNIWTNRTAQLIVVFAILLALLGSGCSVTAPKLSPEDRKRDIQFMADWARDYSPYAKLAQKHKGTPDYEALLPMYLEYAEQAESNEMFGRVAREYFRLICPVGHAFLPSEGDLKSIRRWTLLGFVDYGINPFTIHQSLYWARHAWKWTLTVRPPFGITYKDNKYYTDDDWWIVPRGSQIVKVNGMSCPAYLDYIKENTVLRYSAYPKDWTKEYLLVIDEREDFKGWQVDFILPDKSTQNVFVHALRGLPDPSARKGRIQTVEAKDNCTCIELSDEVAYIRIKSMESGGDLSFAIPSLFRRDGKMIKAFLDDANGKYHTLIIDVRNNPGGAPYYVYENLIRPFLNESVTYDEVSGLRRRYRDSLTKSELKTLRSHVSGKKENVVNMEEIDEPEGFDPNEFVFYRITRRIEPGNQYNFNGSVYVMINKRTFSAADIYANLVKRLGIGKLVGQNTRSGYVAYIQPTYLRLPASGMIFVVETELSINPDGSVHALFGTEPDIQLEPADPPNSITKEDLLKDKWIEHIINEL
jgi:hypothetical protein